MSLSYQFLFDRPEETKDVVNWWNTVWADRLGLDLSRVQEQLSQSLSKTDLPIHFSAILMGCQLAQQPLKIRK